jgi:hypothetical protein
VIWFVTALQADGKTLLLEKQWSIAITRFNIDGSLDTSFDKDSKEY